MKYKIAQHSVIGDRKSNQDRAGFTSRDNAVLMVLGDGLGGYSGGARAAATFVDTVIQSFEQFTQAVIPDPHGFIVLATIHGHRTVNKMASDAGFTEENHPRTTSVVCLVQNGYAYWGHVGDSRLYLFRQGHALKRTEDHTETEERRREGRISESDMRLSENQGPLLRCIGGAKRPVVTLGHELKLEPGDHIMMCSDGLWRAHDSDRMIDIMTEPDDLHTGVRNLVVSSVVEMKRRSDNVTCLSYRHDDVATHTPALSPKRYNSVEQSKLWDDQWAQARERRRHRQKLAEDDNHRFDDEFLEEEINEIDQALSELESFVAEI